MVGTMREMIMLGGGPVNIFIATKIRKRVFLRKLCERFVMIVERMEQHFVIL